MKRWELFVLQIFAVVCTYLITSIMVTSALEIRIYTFENEELAGELLEFSDFIQKEFHYPYLQNYQYIEIYLSGKDPSYLKKKIYLFRCKGLNTADCIESGIQPVVSVNPGNSDLIFDETYRWDDVSSGNGGNFLILTKLDVGGREAWTGSWDRVTKTGIRQFYHESYGMDRVDLYLKSGVSGEAVKNYIEGFHSIPSDDVNHSVFQTISGTSVDELHDLSGNNDDIDPSGTGIPDFYTATFPGDIFSSSLRTWDFVLGSDGKTANPVIFYSTAAGGELPVEGGPELVIDSLSPQVVTCESDEVIEASMHVDNASNIGYFQSYYYEIDGVKGGQGSITCSITNPSEDMYSYECSVPVADFPECSAGQSLITFYFAYQGGIQLSATFPVTLNAPQPKLIVNSVRPATFDCGLDTEITAELQIINPMAETPTKHYTFDGENFLPLTCSGSGNLYTCEIPENEICTLLQENLELKFKFVYGEFDVLSLPTQLFVSFPPPAMGIDTVTPQTVEAGETTSVNVLLHVNYPDFITYDSDDFNYKYLDKDFSQVTCSPDESYTNIKYYRCTAELEIPSDEDGVKTLTFRLDGFMEGEPEQKTANTFFEVLPLPPEPSFSIISTSSPIDCVSDDLVTFTVKAENADAGSIETKQFTYDSLTYHPIQCTVSGNLLSCSYSAEELCDEMKNVLPVIFSFTYAGKNYYTNTQRVYFRIPEPHMQVYSIHPNTLSTGERNSVMVNLYVQYPDMVGDNPVFLYSYLSQASQQMSCTKVSSTNIRDFYECANTEFEIPEDYSDSNLPVMFSIQGTTLSFPINMPVTSIERTLPWMEIVYTNPSRIEIPAGNQTSVIFRVTVHNALENELEHQATLLPSSWISSGSCEEADIDYDFDCDVMIRVPASASAGSNQVTLTLRVSNSRTFDISNTTNVYVIPQEAQIEIQSVNPERLYCEGHTQQNPQTVRITTRARNLDAIELVEEEMSFNNLLISHTARYCTSQGQTITCEIPTDKFLEKVRCGRDELAPGEGSHYYPLTLTFLVESGGELITISGSRDISIEARPLEAYIQIADNDVVDGFLESPEGINCLSSQTIRLGDTGYVRIMYADLLHTTAGEDLDWSFRLDAYDEQGKLTRGMGVSPEANATICRFVSQQMIGAHRIEDYECSLYTSTGMFQRCANGDGELILSATHGGRKAEGSIDVLVIKDDSQYQPDMQIVTNAMDEIECQIQEYGERAKCSLASYSNQNVTIIIYNMNEEVEITDLDLYDFHVSLTGTAVNANEEPLGNCNLISGEANKYVCPFRVGPIIRLPETSEFNVTEEKDTYDSIPLGTVNVTVSIKYVDDFLRGTISKLDGSITLSPKKPNYMINAEEMKDKMQKTFEDFEKIFKVIVFFLSFCAICSAGNRIVDAVEGAIKDAKGQATRRAEGEEETADLTKIREEAHESCYKLCTDKGKGSYECDARCKAYLDGLENCIKSCFERALPDTCSEACKAAILDRIYEDFAAEEETPPGEETPPVGEPEELTPDEECDDYCKTHFVWGACYVINDCINEVGVVQEGVIDCPGSEECCCFATSSTSPRSPSDYQPETGRISFDGEDNGQDDDGGGDGGGDLIATVAAIGSAVAIFLLAKALTKKLDLWPEKDEEADLEEEESEILESMKRGLFWGFMTCVLPRIIGDVGAWIAKEDSTAEDIFKVGSAIGKGTANVCNVLMQLAPVVLMFIQFYISYLRFEMCMEMVEMQIETGAEVAAQAGEGVYQTRATAQTSINMMNSMMGCFDQLMEAMNRLTMTSIVMSRHLGAIGGGMTKVTYMVDGHALKEDDDVCGPKRISVEAEGFCKGGANQAVIRIRGENCRGDSKRKTCVYTMPVVPTQMPMMPTQPYRTGDVLTLNYYLDRDCSADSVVEIEVDGVRPETLTFNYYKNEDDPHCD
ncbi:MAG: hypothetical protein JSV39_03230 [Candidatus Aenigmatarchaeota archaeon]|nr:MAG: hypothetical protein JSV39_03230 [Candidatus Aenigmarchaeota archaeon]